MTPDRRTVLSGYDAGRPLESFTPEERAELRQAILSDAAYFDKKHPHHSMLVRDAARLYAMDTPEAQ